MTNLLLLATGIASFLLAGVVYAEPLFALADSKTWVGEIIQPVSFTVSVDSGADLALPAIAQADGSMAMLFDSSALPLGVHTVVITAIGPDGTPPAPVTKCLTVKKRLLSKTNGILTHTLRNPGATTKTCA